MFTPNFADSVSQTDRSLVPQVVLSGMNGFKSLVTIESFDLPYNDPAGGIHLTLQTSLTNPSSVGVALSTIGFQNSAGATIIGPAASTAAFDLNPKSTIALPLAGRLVPQSTEQGLADVSNIFNGFVHGVPSQLVVHGDYAGPSDCTWLNDGIKQLAIPVILVRYTFFRSILGDQRQTDTIEIDSPLLKTCKSSMRSRSTE